MPTTHTHKQPHIIIDDRQPKDVQIDWLTFIYVFFLELLCRIDGGMWNEDNGDDGGGCNSQ